MTAPRWRVMTREESDGLVLGDVACRAGCGARMGPGDTVWDDDCCSRSCADQVLREEEGAIRDRVARNRRKKINP